ncbi:toll-like receptor 4 [Patella vulgata]|uniref:toll-like receptor 4 n=1 Tax=Patella vulgata TaxID=6465 RepID=UPI0024A81DC6|nr:toll-like receptor 4 [Patella vulgata]
MLVLMVGESVISSHHDICEICVCQELTIDCTNKSLTVIPPNIPPNTTILILKDNNIDEIPDYIFDQTSLVSLDISNNKISNLSRNSFYGLETLITLNLQHNSMEFSKSYPEDVFKPLVNLENLDLSSNLILSTINESYPDRAIRHLKSLQELYIDGIPNLNLGEGFSSLTNLLHLNFSGLNVNQIKHLNITELYLDHNRFELIELEAIPLLPPTLRVISVLDNRPTYGWYLLALENMKNLVCADTSQQYSSHDPESRHKPQSSRYVSSFSKSRDHESTFCQKMNVSSIDPFKNNQSNISSLPVHKRLEIKNDPHTPALSSLSFNLKNFTIKVPPNLEYVNVSKSFLNFPIPNMRFGNNTCKLIDVSGNVFNRWVGPVQGVTKLEWLILSNNFCDYIKETFFDSFPGLRKLFVASNFLAAVFEADVKGNIFHKLQALETLDISENKIRTLPSALLRGQVNLQKLDLSKNILKVWTLDIDHMKDLRYIDLSSNQMTSLPVQFRNYGDRQYDDNKQLTVDLSGQTLQCTCETLPFLKWMKSNTTIFVRRDDYKCEDNKKKELILSNLDAIIIQLERQCASLSVMVIILTGSLFVIASVLIGSLIYRYRWKLRYLYYLTRNRYHRAFPLVDNENTQFEYHAFVSYADEDRLLVTQDMRQKLETEHGLNLCIHHRDFLPGEDIAANILSAVRNSKKTLILLTKNFLNSYWCIYELNMAKVESISTGRNVITVIVCERIPVNELPEALVQSMRADSYIDYTDDPEGSVVFWANLRRSIIAD